MKKSNIYFRHLKELIFKNNFNPLDYERHPYATICVILFDKYVSVGVALCSKKDQFEYKKGRQIAKDKAVDRLLDGVGIEDLSFCYKNDTISTQDDAISLINKIQIDRKNKKIKLPLS